MILVVAAAWAAPVEALVAGAVARDPDVAAAEAALEAARGARTEARFLRDNPTVDGVAGFGAQQIELTLMQPVSLRDEGGRARRAADARVRAAELQLDRARLEAAAEARLALTDLIASTRDAALAAAAAERARALREAVEAQLAVGAAPEVDAQLARLAEAAAVGGWLAAVRDRDRARIAVLAATGLEALDLPDDPLAAAPPEGDPAGFRSDLRAAEARVDAATAALAAADAAAIPPVGVGVWAQWQNVGVGPGPEIPPWSGENVAATVGPALSIEVPLWQRNEGARAEARGAVGAALAEAAHARAAADAELRTLAAREAEVSAVLDAMPPLRSDDAEAAVGSIRAAYAEGQLSGLEVTAWLDRIGAAERAIVAARREAAVQRIERALAEEWPTLIGAP